VFIRVLLVSFSLFGPGVARALEEDLLAVIYLISASKYLYSISIVNILVVPYA